MLETLARNWWAIAIRGLAAIAFGCAVFFIPSAALWALILLFGAYCLIDGVLAVLAAVRAAGAHERWAQLLIAGLFGILIAGITWFDPAITAFALLYVIAAWAIVTGVLELIAAFELRKHLEGEFWWMLSAIISIMFGVLIVWRPAIGALAILFWIGMYAVISGIVLLGFAFKLRDHAQRPTVAA